LREVEDSLVSFRADRIERDRLAAVLASAQDTFHLASSLYTHGLSQYLQVLDAQRTVESAHQQLVQEDMTLANDVVGLYRALGGGWEQPGAKSDAPDVPGAPPVVPAAADALAAPE
jgi:multidrug efflux system outer membrane protein